MTINAKSEAGFTMIEALVATAIMVIVTAGVFSVLNPSQGIFQTQPEVSDMQQRLRVGVDQLKHDLMNAGAGSYSGLNSASSISAQQVGSLINYFAPIWPSSQGADPTIDQPPGTFTTDRITIIYVPSTGAQTTVKTDMASTSASIYVNTESGCPQVNGVVDPLCGFKAPPDPPTKAAIYDGTGAFDTFVVTARDESAQTLDLQHTQNGGALSKAYKGTSSVNFTRVAEIAYHVYYLNAPTKQLMHYDGLSTATPVLDNVVGLRFDYYGDPQAPVRMKPDSATDRTATYGPTPPDPGVPAPSGSPWATGENCTWQMSGGTQVTKLASLGVGTGLVQLTSSQLTDGPWCPDGTNSNKYDADLFRIRKIRVTLRLQTGNDSLRAAVSQGQTALFTNAGTSKNTSRAIPDQSIRFDVTPRNMNLGR